MRKKIREFSRNSMAKFREFTASIPRRTRKASQMIDVCLTFPADHPKDPSLCKRRLWAFLRRLEREYGEFPIIWKQEFQGREAIHYHLVLFLPPSMLKSGKDLRRMREFVARSWYTVCGEICEEHLGAGTSVGKVRDWLDTVKYLAKPERVAGPEGEDQSPGKGPDPGRFWGIWHKELLHIAWETVRISMRDFYAIRRVMRRLVGLKPRGTVRTMNVFVGDEVVERILPHPSP
ncbi:MAG: hypothetical protein AVDCRST_MAG05-4626 [uncultured Rubrobacteraceae bacterium]|uniref:Replication-associated protein ORF2/G2P domain-containing protein n=1 Tax=uncultured Rubrobacteraceae bacterium TaxID=349277 RepID=A0A6J4TVZ8_9ACTN|nr:MAG: hypothetical protein AVDCRST_MAG05-4626 [uncultured Rubrobacteraceae bacterium]